MEEIWKKYKYSDYSTIEVSNLGNIKKDGKLRHFCENQDGYLTVKLNHGKNKKGYADYRNVLVHRLVLSTFLEERNYKDGWEVNHIDYNRKNNCLSNLEWCTHEENIRHSICNKPDMNGENNPNYGNKKLSKIYSENPKYALEKQSRKGLQNGRCRKIIMHNENINLIFNYMEDCIKYLVDNNIPKTSNNVAVRGGIDRSIRNNTKYFGYSFEKL